MLTRSKTKNKDQPESKPDDSEVMDKFKSSENMFNQLLSPWEPYVMTLQSLLVCENPQHSAILFIIVNFLFWLATTLRFYYLVGVLGFFIVFLDMWWARIWPEIRVPPPPEDQEGWTPVHPKLLSVPELSHYCSKVWVTSSSNVQWVISLREQSHAKFFLLMSTLLSSLAFLGTKISGILLCYISVMSVLVIPALIYHNILQEVYAHIEPYIFKFEKTFNVKRKKRSRKVKKKSGMEDSTISVTSQPSDSEEEILNEFVPSPHPSLLSTLSKATGRESDGDHTPSRLTPDNISRGPSRDLSDSESHGDETNFSQDLSEIPSYDDAHLEDSVGDPGSLASLRTIPDYDELDRDFKNDPDLDLDETMTTGDHEVPTKTQSETIDFKESHFKESSESGGEGDPLDDENLVQGLESMPDVEDVLEHEQQESQTHRANLFGQAQALISSEAMTHTVSNLMANTMSGLSRLGESMRTATGASEEVSQGGPNVRYSSGSGVEIGDKKKPGHLTESVDSDTLLAEFDFLEDEDLDVMDDQSDRKKENL